ncbi:MAG: hypothetical protein NTV31_02620 [Bacteroidia bacterium]|nr:hypothetical protein [Bacteroidia bacterium]
MSYLIPLPGEKGRKNKKINVLAPLPWERGWGEVDFKREGARGLVREDKVKR